MSILRSNAVRNIGGILNPKLFQFSHLDTKDLIQEYFFEVSKSLEYISSQPADQVSHQNKLEFFRETRHAFGRTALVFSGGAGMGLYHYGVWKALYLEGLLPRIISGTSVGSIFAAYICTTKPCD